jgi:hypothetical protein
MPFRPLLLLNISLIENNTVNYLRVSTFLILVAIAVLAIIWL